MGILLFFMLTGKLPFQSNNDEKVLMLIKKTKIDDIIPKNLAPNTKKLIKDLLTVNKKERINFPDLYNTLFEENPNLQRFRTENPEVILAGSNKIRNESHNNNKVSFRHLLTGKN